LPEVPSDLAMESAMCPRYDFKQNQTVCHRYAEIPEMYEQARAEGITHFFISGWNRQGFDTDYPEFVPDMELGSSWDLARGCEYVRVGSAEPFPCYEPGHAHSEPSHVHRGQYNHGYLKMIREVRDRIRALDP